jgi:CheY-like chemotaxis protein
MSDRTTHETALPHTLLCVEDDDSLRLALRRRLTSEGFSVTDVRNGAEAMVAASRHVFEVGVFDIDLSGDSGVRLAQRLLILRRVRRAVFFSASTHHDELSRARAHGLVVRKSAGFDQLIHVIRHPSKEPS